MWTARNETPRNSVIAITAIAVSVRAALRDCGGRKADTPFEIASTPVSAADPDANALSTRNRATVPAPAAIGCGATACGHEPAAHLATPVAIITYRTATKP